MATTHSLMTTPRQLTTAKVLFYIVFVSLDSPVGSWSENLVSPLVECIQAHRASEEKSLGYLG